MKKLFRSADSAPHDFASRDERWHGADEGLIGCWERGRVVRLEQPDLASRAMKGELVTLSWKGGTENIGADEEGDEKKAKSQKRYGNLNYLATWQGLRGENLDIELDAEVVIVCSRTKRSVIFRRTIPVPD
jgi:hypothetical protein